MTTKFFPRLLFLFGLLYSSISFSQDFTSFDGIRIAYTDEGSGEPILLIHGFISNGSSWNKTRLKADLLTAGYRVIVPDLRGNGRSDRPEQAAAYANEAEIKDLILLINHLGLQELQAIGYSRGAIVLAKLLTIEKRIGKAALGGMGQDFTNPNWDRRLLFAEAFGAPDRAHPDTKGAIEYARSIGADLQVLSHLQTYQPVTSPSELAQIQQPILVIAGDQDRDNGNPAELQKMLPKAQLKIVPGDHNGTYKTQAFADAVIDFITDEEAQLMQSIHRFNQAFEVCDLETLDYMTTDNYRHTNGNSKAIPKTAWFNYLKKRRQALKEGTLTVLNYEMAEEDVQLHGQCAVLTAKINVRQRNNGETSERAYRVTHLWVKTNGHWQRAAFQDTKL